MARFLFAVWYDVDQAEEAEWDRWMSSSHVPEVVKKGRFLGAKRYIVREGSGPKHLTLYEAKDQTALKAYFEGPAKELREDYQRHYGDRSRLSRVVLEETLTI